MLVQFDPQVVDAAAKSLWISTVAVWAAAVVGVPLGAALARRAFTGYRCLLLLFRAGMSVPTVLIGLLCYGVFSRRGVFGSFDLIYTPSVVMVGEFFLALPIIVTWTHAAVGRLDPRLPETAKTLGANLTRRAVTYLHHALPSIYLAVLTAFSRCFTELGIAMMVGGNLPGRTRTLTTATALETSRGDFSRGVAMSVILLFVALLVTCLVSWLRGKDADLSV